MKNTHQKNSQNQSGAKPQGLVVKVDREILFKSGVIRSIPERAYYLGRYPKTEESWQICITRKHPNGATSFLLTGIIGHSGIFEAAMVELALNQQNFELTKSVFNLKPTQDEKAVERLVYDALEVHARLGRPLPPELETGLYMLQYSEQEVQDAVQLATFQKKMQHIDPYVAKKKRELQNKDTNNPNKKPGNRKGNRHHQKMNRNANRNAQNDSPKYGALTQAEKDAVYNLFGKPANQLIKSVMGNAIFISNVPLPKAMMKAFLDEAKAGRLSNETVQQILYEQMVKNEQKPSSFKQHPKNHPGDQVGEPAVTYAAQAKEADGDITCSTMDDEQAEAQEAEEPSDTFNVLQAHSSGKHTSISESSQSDHLNSGKTDSTPTDCTGEAHNQVEVSSLPISLNPTDALHEAITNSRQAQRDPMPQVNPEAGLEEDPRDKPEEEPDIEQDEAVAQQMALKEAQAALCPEAAEEFPANSPDREAQLAHTFGAYLNMGLNHGSELQPADYTLLAQRLLKKFPDIFNFNDNPDGLDNRQIMAAISNKTEDRDIIKPSDSLPNDPINGPKLHQSKIDGTAHTRETFEQALRELAEDKKQEAIQALGPDVPIYDPDYCKNWSIYDWREFMDQERKLRHSPYLLCPEQFQPLMRLFRAWVRDMDAHEPTMKELKYLKDHPAMLSERQLHNLDYKATFEEIEFQFEICTQFAAATSTADKQQVIARMEGMLEKYPENPFFWHRLHEFHLKMDNPEQAFRIICRQYNTSKDRQTATVRYFMEILNEYKLPLLTDFLKDTVLLERRLSNPPLIFNEEYYHQYYQTLAQYFTASNQWMEFITLVDQFHELATSRNNVFRMKFWNILYKEAVFFMNEILVALNSKPELKDTFLDCIYNDDHFGTIDEQDDELENDEVQQEDDTALEQQLEEKPAEFRDCLLKNPKKDAPDHLSTADSDAADHSTDAPGQDPAEEDTDQDSLK